MYELDFSVLTRLLRFKCKVLMNAPRRPNKHSKPALRKLNAEDLVPPSMNAGGAFGD